MLISYYWKDDNSVGKLRWYNLVQELKKLNYNITVFSFGDKYKIIEKDNITEIIWKNNSLLNSFKERYLNNYSKGVIDSSDSLFVKFLSWIRVNFFYPDASISNLKKIQNYIIDYIDKEDINLLITTSPPHSIQLLGQRIKKQTGIEWISDFRGSLFKLGHFIKYETLKYFKKNSFKLSKSIFKNF